MLSQRSIRFTIGKAIVLCLVTCCVSNPALGQTRIEDFEEQGLPMFDSYFRHEFLDLAPNSKFVELTAQQSAAESVELFLAPGMDQIQFATGADQIVTYAAVTATDYSGIGGTSVMFVDTTGRTHVFHNSRVGIAETFTTSSLDLGAIEKIVLASSEGAFDNLTIEVVPEPPAILLGILALAVGACFALRRLIASR